MVFVTFFLLISWSDNSLIEGSILLCFSYAGEFANRAGKFICWYPVCHFKWSLGYFSTLCICFVFLHWTCKFLWFSVKILVMMTHFDVVISMQFCLWFAHYHYLFFAYDILWIWIELVCTILSFDQKVKQDWNVTSSQRFMFISWS